MYRDRLREIVEFSYLRLREKINGGRICVENEASLQLQLSSILKSTGELFERSKNELFSIELEKPVLLTDGRFAKSGTTKAKIDVWISFENRETKAKHSCAIELKFFKRANHREPNNRYDVFSDIQNLEVYGDFADLGFLIVATDHHHYVSQEAYSQDTADFDFRHGKSYEAGSTLKYKTSKPYGAPISLGSSYSFAWDECSGGTHFLKLLVLPRPSNNSGAIPDDDNKLLPTPNKLLKKHQPRRQTKATKEARVGDYLLRRLGTGTIEIEHKGASVSPVYPVLKNLAPLLNVATQNSMGNLFNTRQLGSRLINAIAEHKRRNLESIGVSAIEKSAQSADSSS